MIQITVQTEQVTTLTCYYKEGGVCVGQVQGDQQAWPHQLDGQLRLVRIPPHIQDCLLPRILL